MKEIIVMITFFVVMYTIITHKINRTISAMLGALFLLIIKIFPDQLMAIEHYIDYNTIFLLIGMMLFVSVIKKSGIFSYIGIQTLKIFGKNGYMLFISLTILVGLISAFIDNVTTILVFIPITFAITDALKINYMPFILGEIFASNIGGTATIIGDPPNIMIASASGMSFIEFLGSQMPISVINLIVADIFLLIVFKKDLSKKIDHDFVKKFNPNESIQNKMHFFISSVLFLIVVVSFSFQHQIDIESSIIALSAGFIALVTMEEKNTEEILKEIEWESILFFMGLFLITGAMEEVGLLEDFSKILISFAGHSSRMFASFMLAISGLFSGFVDNIPFTATMIPVVRDLPTMNPEVFKNLDPIWFSLALGSCLGGNFTPIGASANILGLAMIKQFKKEEVKFSHFMLYGGAIVLMNIIFSEIYINLRYY
ncbi:citrate transporter [Tepiditoga spiralis]|uniref:Citrate transporter n=1 Tax=Tepiditoga spiralis TaxID=2108365 RepID=A0A7G1G757_9BACT|nr:ArsB/NhaD family transporter [Tepiditoga spiralis]BBE30757.1 citrate transporter [Tepiditoga spiralis]